MAALVYIPTVTVRYSIKSVSLFYLPFLYLAENSTTPQSGSNFFKKIAREKTSKAFAWFTIISHILIPLIYLAFLGGLDYRNLNSPFVQDLVGYFSFYPISLLPLSKLLNAGLVFFSIWLARLSIKRRWNEKSELTLRITYLTRGLLTIYSVVILFYILFSYTSVEELSHVAFFVIEKIKAIEFDFSLLPERLN